MGAQVQAGLIEETDLGPGEKISNNFLDLAADPQPGLRHVTAAGFPILGNSPFCAFDALLAECL